MKTVSKKKQKQLEQSKQSQVNQPATKPSSSSHSISAPFGILHPSKGTPSILDKNTLTKRLSECQGEKAAIDLGMHILHDPQVWAELYQQSSPALKRAMRSVIQIQTIQALLSGKYFVKLCTHDDITKEELVIAKPVQLNKKALINSAFSTIMYPSDYKYENEKPKNTIDSTKYLVVEADCLDLAIHLKISTKPDKEPLVLDMASMSLPGGGWRKASAAQEENLHRRTNLMHCLEDPYQVNPHRTWSYPIPQFGGIYAPQICVFRGSEPNGYPMLLEPETVSIVAVAALKMPPTETNEAGEEVLDKKLASDTTKKIKAILNIAIENHHDTLVLGALGCGAYMNPPGHIARLFRDVLNSEQYQGRFRTVAFAILESKPTHSTQDDDSNLSMSNSQLHNKPAIFAKVFGVDLMHLSGDGKSLVN